MQLEWKQCFKTGATVFLLFLLIHYWEKVMSVAGQIIGAAMPLFIGLVIAYIINILMSFYERYYFKKSTHSLVLKAKNPVCLLLAIFSFILIISAITGLVVPELVSCVSLIISDIPPAMEALLNSEVFQELAPEDLYAQLRGVDWKTLINDVMKFVTNGIGSTMNTVVSVVSTAVSNVVTGVLALIFAIYFLLGKESLLEQGKRLLDNYLPKKHVLKVNYVADVINDSFHRYIVGQFTEAIIIGVMCMAGMLIFRFPYAGMIGALIGFTALIPVAGAYIGAIVGFIMIFTVSPVKALLFIVFIVVLQQVEGNLVYPKVVGGSLGLPAVWVLAAVTIGGGLMGIMGMLIGVPIAAALYRLIREDVNRRERKQAMEEAKEDAAEEASDEV